MSEFLTGADLTKKIKEIVGGKNVKCAVAYWGDHGFEVAEDWKIVCDIASGSTSDHALKKLGAPKNKSLKHVKDFHAKVYISDNGVVIGSANASARGLGDREHYSPLLEAGTFHKYGGKTWTEAVAWFIQLFEGASIVDQEAVDLAKCRYRPPIGDRPTSFKGLTALEQIVADPEYFSNTNVGFVICREVADKKEIEKAAKKVVKSDAAKDMTVDALSSWEDGRCFVDWAREDLERLTPHFIEFFFKEKGGSKNVLAHTLTLVYRPNKVNDDGNGHFYTRIADPIIKLPDEKEFPTGKAKISDDDWRILIEVGNILKNKGGYGIFRAHDFARLLRRAMEQVQSQPKIR